MIPFKKPFANLKRHYTVFLETGLIMSLLLFLGITQLPLHHGSSGELTWSDEQEVVQMEKVEQTVQKERPPAPPRPPVPVEVPNDEVVEEVIPDIDAELRLSEQIELPPPPPAREGETEDKEEDFFVIVEQMPKLIGGIQALQQKIRYPEMARKAGIEGRVIVQFIVNEKGEVENPRVVRGIGGGCDKEALRVVRNARFKPGMQRGKTVRVQYSLPVVFILQGS